MYMIEPLKLNKNRIWRSYKGGRALSKWLNEGDEVDNHYPEEWVASTTKNISGDDNNNSTNEGFCKYINKSGKTITIFDLILNNPKKVLGERHFKKYGFQPGILVKILDAAERLSIQVHPTRKQANELFNSSFGKTEAWYILEGREISGEMPHIYVGFRPGMTIEKLKNLFHKQHISEILKAMHKIYVKPGEVYLIPGGMTHAIGAGCLIIEVQEASDYTIRLEKESASGYNINDQLIHQGLGFEKMFQCFEIDNKTLAETISTIRLQKNTFSLDGEKELISYNDTTYFSMSKINIFDYRTLSNTISFSVFIVIAGKGTLKWKEFKMSIKKGDKVFLPSVCKGIEIKSIDKECVSILRFLPPKI